MGIRVYFFKIEDVGFGAFILLPKNVVERCVLESAVG
jgi:hypothetical protein